MGRGSYARADVDDVFGAGALELLLRLLAQNEHDVAGKVLGLKSRTHHPRLNSQHGKRRQVAAGL